MFISHLFAIAVAALASVSFVSAAPTAETDVLVKRGTEDIVLSTLNSLSNDLSVPIGLISLSPLSSLTCTDITPPPKDTAVANNNVSIGSVGGPCNHIITLLSNANANLAGLVPGSWDGHGPIPPVYISCCNVLVFLITVLIPCLSQLVVFITVIPQLLVLLVQIDIWLSMLLSTLGFIIPPIIPIVSNL